MRGIFACDVNMRMRYDIFKLIWIEQKQKTKRVRKISNDSSTLQLTQVCTDNFLNTLSSIVIDEMIDEIMCSCFFFTAFEIHLFILLKRQQRAKRNK